MSGQTVFVAQPHCRIALKEIFNQLQNPWAPFTQIATGGEHARQPIQSRGPFFATALGLFALAQLRGQMTDYERDHEVRAEHHEVLKLLNVERKARRNIKEIPEHGAERGEKERWPSPTAHSGKPAGKQQKKPNGIVPSGAKNRQGNRGDDGGDSERDAEVTPRRARQTFLDRVTPQLHRLLGRDHVDVDIAAVSHEPAQRVALPKIKPARAHRLTDDDLRDVVLAGGG